MGLIVNDKGQVLMALRRPSQSRPNMWEIPGGRVEPNETFAGAVVRELKEELGVDVEVGAFIDKVDLEFEVPLRLQCYAAYIVAGEPAALESVRLLWTHMDYAIVNLPCVPSTYWFYPKIRDYIARIKEIAG